MTNKVTLTASVKKPIPGIQYSLAEFGATVETDSLEESKRLLAESLFEAEELLKNNINKEEKPISSPKNNINNSEVVKSGLILRLEAFFNSVGYTGHWDEKNFTKVIVENNFSDAYNNFNYSNEAKK